MAHGPAFDLIGFYSSILTVYHDILWVGGFDMDVETKVTLMNGQTFKLVCERCGSLTVALPIEAQPDPCSILKCGRCGSPRGTLQSFRDTSRQLVMIVDYGARHSDRSSVVSTWAEMPLLRSI
jgi:NAD-dependent SIR2 family protein deacetylase